jgi:hypothetical protein
MEPFKIYKEIQPTYGEWFSILAELGYQKQVVDIKRPISKQHTKQYLLENLVEKSTIILPYLPESAPVLKAYFANYSHQLYLQGIIEDVQDMAKMIEKKRFMLDSETSTSRPLA